MILILSCSTVAVDTRVKGACPCLGNRIKSSVLLPEPPLCNGAVTQSVFARVCLSTDTECEVTNSAIRSFYSGMLLVVLHLFLGNGFYALVHFHKLRNEKFTKSGKFEMQFALSRKSSLQLLMANELIPAFHFLVRCSGRQHQRTSVLNLLIMLIVCRA